MSELKDFRDTLYKCARCGMCRDISPYEIKNSKYNDICPSGWRFIFEAYYAPGKMEIIRSLLDGELQYSERLLHIAFACPLCGGCEAQCNDVNLIQPTKMLQKLREKIIRDIGPLKRHEEIKNSILEHHNPYNTSHQERIKWIPKNQSINKNSKIAYFVGCTVAYRRNEIAIDLVDLFNNLGLKIDILDDEWCCGSPLFMTGQTKAGIKMMQHNLNILKKKNIEKLIFSCAGCYNTFKNIYVEHLGDLPFEIFHYTEFLIEFLEENPRSFKNYPSRITYHDPCHLGRHGGIYEAPRKLLRLIPELELIEMDRIKENALCCGAGGGVLSAYKDFAEWTALKRIEEAEATGAKILTTSCPFCITNFLNVANEESIKVIPLIEIIRRSI